MKIVNKEFLAFLEGASKEVNTWPIWKQQIISRHLSPQSEDSELEIV